MSSNPNRQPNHESAKDLGKGAADYADLASYPFAWSEGYDYASMPSVDWKSESLDEGLRGADGIYRLPRFDIQEAIYELNAPALEIGGPTPEGYVLLDHVRFPHRPIMSNVNDHMVQLSDEYADDFVKRGDHHLDLLAGANRLPFADESLGVIMFSDLPYTDLKQFDETLPSDVTPENEGKLFDSQVKRQYFAAESLTRYGQQADLRDIDAPRIAAVAEAARTLEPGGLLVMKGPLAKDVELAKSLGFELVMHTPIVETEADAGPREIVMRKLYGSSARSS